MALQFMFCFLYHGLKPVVTKCAGPPALRVGENKRMFELKCRGVASILFCNKGLQSVENKHQNKNESRRLVSYKY